MLNIDTKSGKINASTIEEQMALRENALVQARALASYKLDFLEPGVLSVFVGMLEQPLRKGETKLVTSTNMSALSHVSNTLAHHVIRFGERRSND